MCPEGEHKPLEAISHELDADFRSGPRDQIREALEEVDQEDLDRSFSSASFNLDVKMAI